METLPDFEKAPLLSVNFFEIYIDYFKGKEKLLSEWIEKAITQGKKIIITVRRPEFAQQTFSFDERIVLLETYAKLDVYFDIDLEKEKKEFEFLLSRYGGKHLIASFHNYEGTPDTEGLLAITKKLSESGAAFIKISSMALTLEDQNRLVCTAIMCKESNLTWIVSPMGQYGRSGRVITALLGSAWTYTSFGRPSAQGQMSLDDFLELRELLGKPSRL